MADIVRILLGLVMILVGIFGCFLPVLPGPLLVYAALFILQITTDQPFSLNYLLARFAITVLVTVLDYFIPILGTKRMGGTKRGTRGATIGLIIGIILLPILGITIGPFGIIGIIGGPFLGAYIGERIHGKSHALKSAFGSFLGFLAGTLLKLVVSLIMAAAFFKESRSILKELF